MLYANLLLNVLYHIEIEMKIRESCLQTGNFIYKPGISLTKQDFHLQRESLGLQRGFSGYYLPIENGQSDVVSDIEVSESLKILRQNMRSVLSDREYYIITKRFGLDGEKELTQRQIAKTLSISRSYVSRIEKAGLKKLRKLLE